MVFSSPEFLLVFLPAVFIIYYLIGIGKKTVTPGIRTARNIMLFIASIFFYAWGEPVNVFLMLLSIIITWALGIVIDRNRAHSKAILTIGIIYHVMMMFVFKYLTFVSGEIARAAGKESTIDIALPIGISFYTFQLMSYLFDVYYRNAEVQANPLYVGLYTAFFPQLIAGPIVRYQDIADEIRNRKESLYDISEGMKRFIYGLAKKVLIANYVAKIADNVFDSFTSRSVALAWLGTIAYTLQIYFDFSGYSDMAIGLGRMFGFHFKENFNYPYIATSVTDFWRRWHISLSRWFRDYVYIPLGGNRVSRGRWIFNIFIVWLLTGIWHGANWTFILWGLIYFVLLVFERFTGIAPKAHKQKNQTAETKTGSGSKALHVLRCVIGCIITMVIVNAEWAIFRADSIHDGLKMIANMFGIRNVGLVGTTFIETFNSVWKVMLIAIIAATPLYMKLINALKKIHLGWIEQVWLVVIAYLSVIETVSSTYNPFIYFNF